MDTIDQALHSLLEAVPGSIVAALLGLDGLAVQMAWGDDGQGLNHEVMEIELAALAVAVQKAAVGIKGTESGEFFLATGQANFLGAQLDSAYFVVLGLAPNGDLEHAGVALAEVLETFHE